MMGAAIAVLGVLMLSGLGYASWRGRHATGPARAAARPVRAATIPAPARRSATSPAREPDAPRPPTEDAPARLAAILADTVERYKLPPFPTAVIRAMQAIREPKVELEQVCRIIATDAALAGRVVSLSRSPLYALRRPPQTLLEATTVLGLTATRRILATAGMAMLQGPRTATSEQLWHHGLATAIAAHLLAARTGTVSPDQMYLAGLLHDVGQVVLLQSNEGRFLECWPPVNDLAAGCRAETTAFGRHHAFIGASILFQWNIDHDVVDAVLNHHDGPESVGTNGTVVALADHLAHRAGFGFVAEPASPSDEVRAAYGCLSDDDLARTVAELQSAFAAERALLG